MRRGSFDVLLSLDLSRLEQAKLYLFGEEFKAAAELPELIVGSSGLTRLSFDPCNKWKCSDGAASFTAHITDERFWNALHQREMSFADGDALVVYLRVENGIDSEGEEAASSKARSRSHLF